MRLIAVSSLVLATVLVSLSASAQGRKRAATIPAPAPAAAAEAAQAPELARDSEVRRGLKFEAYFDVEGRITNKDWVNDRGFTLNDASLYLSKDFNRGYSAHVDLPFHSVLAAGQNNFAFAQDKAQAFFMMNRSPLVVKLGQWDTPFGIEQNDSRDRFFADAGALKSFVLPATHTGAQVGFVVQNFVIRGILANPSDNTALATNDPEFGGQIRFDAGAGYGAFGLTLSENKTVATDKTAMLVNVMGGLNVEKLKLEGEFDILKTPGNNKTGNAFMGLATFQLNEDMGVGGRFEYLKDTPVTAGGVNATVESWLGFAFGANYKLEQDILVRGDFSLANIKPGGGVSDETVFGLTTSLVVSL